MLLLQGITAFLVVALTAVCAVPTGGPPLTLNLLDAASKGCGNSTNSSNSTSCNDVIIVSTTMTTPAKIGDTKLQVKASNGFKVGVKLTIAKGASNEETIKLAGFGSLILAAPLKMAHLPGESIEQELPKGDEAMSSQCAFRKLDGSCVCPPGTKCPQLSCPNNCSGHGDCVGGDCVCQDTWLDTDCSFQLECPGKFIGPGTAIYCSGHGTCNKTNYEAKLYCECDTHYFGKECNQGPWYCGGNFNCSNNGTCNYNTGLCECDRANGWSGKSCETKLWTCPEGLFYDDLHPNGTIRVCAGFGKCVNGNCVCKVGHHGSKCEFFDLACGKDYDCGEHGTCVQGGIGDQATCVCKDNWYGWDCSMAAQLCDRDFECVHGFCAKSEVPTPFNTTTEHNSSQTSYIKTACVCEHGWGGIACNKEIAVDASAWNYKPKR